MKAYVVRKKCPAQEMVCKAIPVCKNQAISFVEDSNEPLGGRIEIDHLKCDGCGTCATECCGDAIEIR